MEKVNGDDIQSKVDIADVIGKRIALKKRGSELYGICPFHDDTSESLQVNPRKQIFKCFACGAGGDAIEFLRLHGATFHEAVKELNGGDVFSSSTIVKSNIEKPKPKEPEWFQVSPVPPEAKAPVFKHFKHGEASKVWTYLTAEGSVSGHVCRFDLPGGKKEVLPLVYATNGTKNAWRWLGFSKPRPLYNLWAISQKSDATIIVVEGEKTAEAAKSLLPKAIVTTWIGGSNGVEFTDWTPLSGRNILFWPDNDIPGIIAMYHVSEINRERAGLLKIIGNPSDAPKGWDVADAEGWTAESTRQHVLSTLTLFREPDKVQFDTDTQKREGKPVRVWIEGAYIFGWFEFRGVNEWRVIKKPDAPIFETEPEEPPKPKAAEPPPEIAQPVEDLTDGRSDIPFKFLGFDKSESGTQNFWFYVQASKTTVRLSAGSMSTANLMTLAPLQWWEGEFPTKGKADFDGNAAVNFLIGISNKFGAFKPRNIRGRGAWIDAGRVVLHSGDKLIVDGTPYLLGTLKSKYIYETGEELGFHMNNPLHASMSSKLIDILKLINWERGINAHLLAGWCVIAPICGALSWRPHVWLTGSAGTGKSWVFQKIVRRLLSITGIAVQSETTEAGIRQILQHDAMPIVFDEAEGEDNRAAERMDRVLALMRAASTDDGGILAKGTPGGGGKTFTIRSCFAFASISVQVKHQSDRGRVTVLGLNNYAEGDLSKADRWKKLQESYAEVITDEFVRGLQARTIDLLPTILANAQTFAAAAAAEIGGQRTGDQLGALLAGAYSLVSSKAITFPEAVKWIQAQGSAWNEERAADRMRDENALLSYLMEQNIRLDSGNFRTIGEIVISAAAFTPDDPLSRDAANDTLKRYGFKYDEESKSVFISNSAKEIARMLDRTAWQKNHNKILLRITGAKAVDSTRFAGGLTTRAVAIPVSLLAPDK